MNRCLLDNFCYDLELQVDISISDLTNYIYEFYEIWTTICKITTLIFDCEKCNYAIMKKKFDSLNQNIMWNDRNVPEHILIYKRILAAHIDTMYNLPSDLQITKDNSKIYINYRCLCYSTEKSNIKQIIYCLSLCADFDYYLNSHLINTVTEDDINVITYYNDMFIIAFSLDYVTVQNKYNEFTSINDDNNYISFEINENIIETIYNHIDKYYPRYIRSFVMKFED